MAVSNPLWKPHHTIFLPHHSHHNPADSTPLTPLKTTAHSHHAFSFHPSQILDDMPHFTIHHPSAPHAVTTFVSSKPEFYHHNHPWNEGTLDYPNAPNVDVRETEEGYVFDLEVPGVHDKKAITLSWKWSRTLVIEGRVPRVGAEAPSSIKAEEKESKNDLVRVPSHDHPPKASNPHHCSCFANVQGDGKTQPSLLLAERRVGPWERHFSFPADVHKKNVRAHLEDGLLRVWVEKLEEVEEEKTDKEKGADIEWI